MSPETKVPAYKSLPPLGSAERKKMIEALKDAFGDYNKDNPGAVDPDTVYDQLSQLSYQDRITLLYQVFRSQHIPDFIEKGRGVAQYGEPELYVVATLRTRLSTDTAAKNTFGGARKFLHLMSDAPQDDYHAKLLNGNIAFLKSLTFVDKNNEEVEKPLALLTAYDPGYSHQNDPARLLRLVGVTRGKPPLRTKNPLGMIDAPKYEALPDTGSKERNELIAALNKAMGKTSPFVAGRPSFDYKTPSDPQITKDFKGIGDPDAFFKLMGKFDYKSRLEIYRDVLSARGEDKLALGTDFEIRQSLMFRLTYTHDNKKMFAGFDKFLRLVADAPRGFETDQYMKDEIVLTSILSGKRDYTTLGREFEDKDDTAVRSNYQRFFSVGGPNKEYLPFDWYNRMEMMGIPVGKPPLTQVKTEEKPTKTGQLDLFRLDTLRDFGYPDQRFGLPRLLEPRTIVSLPLDDQTPLARPRLYTPIAYV